MKAKGNLRRALFGVALAALVGACTHEVSEPEVPAAATGKLTVSLTLEGVAASGSAARTVYPDLNGLVYSLSFEPTEGGAAHAAVAVTGGSATIDDLVVGTYTIRATAKQTGGDTEIAIGTKTGVVISAGATASASITLGPKLDGANGILSYDITVPTAGDGTLTITPTAGTPGSVSTVTLNGGSNQATVTLGPGYYLVQATLNLGTKNAGFTETVHIYSGLTSALPAKVYSDENFTEPAVVSAFDLTTLFPAPVTDAAPETNFDAAQYTGSIQWKAGGSAHTGNFAAATEYTAELTLTAKAGFTFTGVGANAFSHGTITGTNVADSGAVSFTFPATAAPQQGSLGVNIGFAYGDITVSGDNGTNTIKQAGSPNSLELSVTGFDGVVWYVDGKETALTGNPITLSAADYAEGPHSISFYGTKAGIPYSREVVFTVEAATPPGGGDGVLSSVAAVATYLATATGGTSEADPVSLEVALNYDTDGEALLNAIETAGKYVTLDLSACTLSGTVFNPNLNSKNNNGKTKVLSLVLPNAATSVTQGAGVAYASFKEFSKLKSIESSGIITIQQKVFSYPALTTVNFPNATIIEINAFESCSALTTVNIPNVETINMYAFQSCTALTTVNFPKVTTINISTFAYCSALTTVNLAGVTTISSNAFESCSALTTVNIPSISNIPQLSFLDAFKENAVVTIIMGSAAPALGNGKIFQGVNDTVRLTIQVPSAATGYDDTWKTRLLKNGGITSANTTIVAQ
ncbi:MAG: leucine-rich repeat domain-containing protein [Treponema sp.]|jgi:hypothetical protein|nr:leucine-rich repeat domain-containing protein [Treponema sp.]